MTPSKGAVGTTATLLTQAPEQQSRVTVQVGDGIITVTATGRVDQKIAVTFREELLEVWPVCVGVLAVDLSACTYLSIDAVRALQDVWRLSPHVRGQLQITAAHPDVAAVLDTANIPRIRAAAPSSARARYTTT